MVTGLLIHSNAAADTYLTLGYDYLEGRLDISDVLVGEAGLVETEMV